MVDGVFAQVERMKAKATVRMTQTDGWKEKVVEWIREERINGRKIRETAIKVLVKTMRAKLEPNDVKKAKKLNGVCGKMLNICKKMPVHEVLQAAKAQRTGGDK